MFAVFLCSYPYKAGQSVLCYIHWNTDKAGQSVPCYIHWNTGKAGQSVPCNIHWNTGSYTFLPYQLLVHIVLNLSPPTQALRRRVGHSGQLSLVRPGKHGRVLLLAFQKLSVCVENMPPCMYVGQSERFCIYCVWGRVSLVSAAALPTPGQLTIKFLTDCPICLSSCHRSGRRRDAHHVLQPFMWVWGSTSGLQQALSATEQSPRPFTSFSLDV